MKPSIDLLDTQKYQAFLKTNFNDPARVEEFNKQTLYRSRRTALIMGGSLIVGLISLVFAFIQNVKFEYVSRNQSAVKNQLEVCVQEAQKQQGLATENRIILEEANKMAEEQLKACQSRK